MLSLKTREMKKLIFIAICFVSLQLSAQGNLQFNQVIKVSDTPMAVPAGKVWKIESYQQSNVSGTSNSTNGCDVARVRPYIIDGQVYHNIKNIASGNAGYVYTAENRMPIWLAAGQTAATSCPSDFLSIIEFNVVP
jgi:hypothetical protein